LLRNAKVFLFQHKTEPCRLADNTAGVVGCSTGKAAAIISAGPVGTKQAYVLLTRDAEAMYVADTGDKA